jgi:hypothetical protein
MDLRRVLDDIQPARPEPPKSELQELKSALAELRREVKILQAQLARKPDRGHTWMMMMVLISAYTTILAIATRLVH